MILFTVLVLLFVTIQAQIYPGGYPPYFNPFSGGRFNPIPPGTFQGGVFSPDWGTNLANSIRDATRNALRYGGINSVNGITTVTQNIGGRYYTAQLPPYSSVSTHSITTNTNGQLAQKVTITVNGDVTVYTTINGRTFVTDAYGNPRLDGGPFRIIQ